MLDLCLDYLVKLQNKKMEVDDTGVGWIGHIPITAGIVRRWDAAGLIDDYGVGTKVLSSKGERAIQSETKLNARIEKARISA